MESTPSPFRLAGAHLNNAVQKAKDAFLESVKATYASERSELENAYDVEARALQARYTHRAQAMVDEEAAAMEEIAKDFEEDPAAAFARYSAKQSQTERCQVAVGDDGTLQEKAEAMSAAAGLTPTQDRIQEEPLETVMKTSPTTETSLASTLQFDAHSVANRMSNILPALSSQLGPGLQMPHVQTRSAQRQVNTSATEDLSAQGPSWPAGNMTDSQTKFLIRKLNYIIDEGYSLHFRKPVNPTTDHCPDYHNLISQPMDLSKLKNALTDGKYASVQAFMNDFGMISANSMVYNGAGHEVTKAALLMEKEFTEMVANIPTCKATVCSKRNKKTKLVPTERARRGKVDVRLSRKSGGKRDAK